MATSSPGVTPGSTSGRTAEPEDELAHRLAPPRGADELDTPQDEAHPGPRFINRELSWLEFNARVLALAEDATVPLLERVKFLAIYSTNLDEFFQVRVSGLQEQRGAGVTGTAAPDGMTPAEQLEAIRERVLQLQGRVDRTLVQELLPALESERIRVEPWSALSTEDRMFLSDQFRESMFPVLTPLSVDPAHPFPYISSLSLNLAAIVRDPMTGDRRFARVKVPPLLPRFFAMPDGERFVPLEQVIAAHLDSLFPGMEIHEHHVFRVTRDADIELEEEEADDLLDAIESVLRRRRRGALPVRLEIAPDMSPEVRELLIRELDLEDSQVFVSQGLLDLGGLSALHALDRPDLRFEPWAPVTQARLAREEAGRVDLFKVLRDTDVLVHHPYDSFGTSVEAFVEQAAADPNVLAIKQSLYRTSGRESAIIRSLSRAAEAGKQVVALVELKARFDEEANITWARALEQSGVHVVYGMVGLKTHAKALLVVRREGAGIRRYAHVGTGNYNAVTARLYEDVGLLSADPELGQDLSELFNGLTGYSRQRDFRKLVVAPAGVRPTILELIKREAKAPDGEIVLKMNSLVDADMIEALYEASIAGASVSLIVRGICCLRPGVPGMSDTIRVRSIVGRYLEHSRIFRFGSRERGRDHYIGSADLMPRNLDRRVEAVAPVTDPHLQVRLDEILEVCREDDTLAWELDPDAGWTKVPTTRGVDAQIRLQELAMERARGER
ncbi:MAG: polyphosphate kinase 1 [Actinomycetota bacterium]